MAALNRVVHAQFHQQTDSHLGKSRLHPARRGLAQALEDGRRVGERKLGAVDADQAQPAIEGLRVAFHLRNGSERRLHDRGE